MLGIKTASEPLSVHWLDVNARCVKPSRSAMNTKAFTVDRLAKPIKNNVEIAPVSVLCGVLLLFCLFILHV